MINMFQNETGGRIQREVYAESDISYYQFVKQGSTATFVAPATARAEVIGVSIPSQLETMDDGNGYQVKRTKFPAGQLPEIIVNGYAYVKLGSGAGQDVPAGTRVMADSSGYAVPYAAPASYGTISKDGAPTTSEIVAIGTAIVAEMKVIAGRMLDKGSAGDLVRVDLEDRR